MSNTSSAADAPSETATKAERIDFLKQMMTFSEGHVRWPKWR